MAKPTLTRLTQLAEVIAAIGVILSLIWVAVELRMNTREIRATNAFDITAFAVENRLRLLEIGTSELTARTDSGEPLSEADKRDLRLLYQYLFQEIELVYYQYTEGRLDAEIMAAWEQRLRNLMASERARNHWETSNEIYSARFRDYVASL